MKLFVQYCLAFIALFLSCLVCFCQERSYIQFTVEDGLASDVVYDVAMDKDGFIWFATNCGVSMYDGYGFKNFSTEDGLADIENFEFREDHQGRLWLMGYSNRLSIIENQKIHPYEFNDTIQKYVNENSLPLDLYIDKLNSIVLSTTRSECFRIDSSGFFSIALNEYHQDTIQSIVEIEKDVLFRRNYNLTSNKGFQKRVGEHNLLLNFIEFETELNVPTTKFGRVSLKLDNKSALIQKSMKELWIVFKNENKKIFEFNSLITLIEETNSQIFVGCLNGLFSIKNYHKQISIDTILLGIPITGITTDFENGLWLSTLKNGVLYIPNSSIYNLEMDDLIGQRKISRILTDENKNVFVGDNGGNVLIIDSNFHSHYFSNFLKNNGEISSVTNLGDGKFAFCANNREVFVVSERGSLLKLKQNSGGGASLKNLFHFDGNLFASGRSLFIVNNDLIIPFRKDLFNQFNPLCFLNYNDSLLFIGSNRGIFCFDKIQLIEFIPQFFKNKTVNSIQIFEKKFFLINVKGEGLFVVPISFNSFPRKINLDVSRINVVKIENSNIWVGTEKGLYKISIFDTEPLQWSSFKYSTKNGLNSNFINDLCFSDSNLYVASNNGINFFNYGHRLEKHFPRVNILEISYGGLPVFENSTLPYLGENIVVSFTGLSYLSNSEIEYKYRLNGFNSDFEFSNIRNISYSLPESGTYQFEVHARNHLGIWSKEPATFSFTILPPFWQTWWFYTIEGILSISLVFLLVNWRINKLKFIAEKEKQQETDKMKLELEALRYRMNPHFLFNTLNSIQSFISTRQKDEAVKYLSRFSRLIRSNLEHSQGSAISVQEEIDTLSGYLELEQMRFNNEFEFEISNALKGESDSIKIPSMLIQPYVENAVLHGVGKLNGKGLIKVSFQKFQEKLLVTIEDNGPGRGDLLESNTNENKGHKSVGMSITKKRLALLNKRILEPVLEIDDLHNDGKPAGTRVKVLIDLIID